MRKCRMLCLMAMLLTCQLVWAQTRDVTGRVVDQNGNTPLSGVTVSARGGTPATTTDANGNFSLRVPGTVTTLVFTYVGYAEVQAPISSGPMSISMRAGASTIDEVVVTGYTTIQRKKFSGATVAVPINEVRTAPFGSFDQALQGNAAGVSVIASSGQPGANAVVRIRGIGSISGGNVPLYILDGIQISAADFASLNQGDFENVEILKDAVATAMYGSRGANGVIVITTRRGRAGQINLNYDAQVGFSDLPKDRLVMMNSQQKIDYELQRGNPFGWTPAQADSLRLVNFNWRDALFRTGMTQQHQLSASGGSQASRFFASLSYMDQEGIVKNTGLKRYTTRINVDNNIKNFRFGATLQGGYSRTTNTSEGATFTNMPLNAIRWTNPYDRDFDPRTGDYQQTINPTTGRPTGQFRSGQPNGALELFENRRFTHQVKGIATTYLEYHLPWVTGLFARTNWGIDYTQNEFDFYTSPRTSAAQSREGSLQRQFNRNLRYTGTTSLNYKRTFDKHEVEAGVFTEVVKTDFRTFGFVGYGFTTDFRNEAGITQGSATNANFIPSVNGSGTQNGILSYFSILNYGYDGKYYATLVGRRDGSSRFGVNNRFANFGSFGLTWVATQENFLRDVKFLNDLRVRASIGTTGSNNAPAGDYPIPMLGTASYAGANALSPITPGNLDYSWETNRTANLGVDFAVLNRRLSGTVEVYDRLTKDLFFSIPVDYSTSGFGSIPSNFGSLRNRGIEIMLRGDVVRTRDFRWTLEGNFTYNQNRIVEIPTDSTVTGVTILAKGRPLNSYFLVPFAGVNSANGNALYRTKDGALTETYSVNDRRIQGTADAPYVGGIQSTISYKGFDLSAQLNYFLGRVLYNNERNNVINPQYYTDNMSVEMLREWKRPGDVTDVPRASSTGGNAFQAETTRLLENADFFRLRNVMLGYTFPQRLLSKANIRSARIFVQGQNWWTWTRFQSYDPELTQSSAQTGAQYPALIQTTVGLSLGF
ncbi:SusC/RagA family TonB-linked outer membrane protein [Aridibaculum aurantiacum]|uniref:SusC/RagA family TonB-linked outer membrane protein n=1 Tax=Aridibaculum aurantiacum TaxID=2810307 RepID=UPI001A960296|nr:SusC/RagA family TonB-linked outer membrane protein [Aridibaculum aurantiacum]